MIRFLADEDLHHSILVALRRQRPDIEFVDLRELGMSGTQDQQVLQFAAEHGYLVVTHDTNTMIDHANERTRQGAQMPGLIVAPQGSPIGAVVSDLALIADLVAEGEWEGQVQFIPF